MCKCTPIIRTPFCGRGDCLPPASREPTESLFGANAAREFARMTHGDHLAQFKADQLDAWERRLAQFSNRSDSTGYAGRIGVEVLTELRLTREQAEALATVVQLARNGHYWANNAEQRADPLGYLQSRVEDLADKADTALRDYMEWLEGEGQ